MPSFDVVSEIDHHELKNALDQANREIGTRYDFKGSGAKIEQSQNDLTLEAESEFQVKQMVPILKEKMSKRGIDVDCLEFADIVEMNKRARQQVKVREGLDKDLARKMVKLVKDSKLKVQVAIQGEQLRVSGKKRDDLQQVMQILREAGLGIPLQFNNFRD
ncbi:MAG: YajQ family cyclic di-GMP-binding protein [Gammaproteobacteria bacterium]|nr:YajQ family cyclic di-GMP-binding protein [Gammaproteobacteria bacterium]MDH3858324.1 YajQ family cyclic di-GMP-binding protein [Gammaproteobacteria bacterium]